LLKHLIIAVRHRVTAHRHIREQERRFRVRRVRSVKARRRRRVRQLAVAAHEPSDPVASVDANQYPSQLGLDLFHFLLHARSFFD